MKTFLLFIFIFLAYTPAFAEDTNDCQKHFYMHPMITGRDFNFHKRNFSILESSSIQTNLLPLDMDSLNLADTSILSIGEGAASFIETIIKNRIESKIRFDNVMAIDLLYSNTKSDFYWAQELEFGTRPEQQTKQKITQLITDYPNNYIYQKLQNLELTSEDGTILLFDEIISSNSLNYVLKNSNLVTQKDIIGKTLMHLKIGGYLRSTPSFYLGTAKEILEDLRSQGLIEFSPQRNHYNQTIIIKKLQ